MHACRFAAERPGAAVVLPPHPDMVEWANAADACCEAGGNAVVAKARKGAAKALYCVLVTTGLAVGMVRNISCCPSATKL